MLVAPIALALLAPSGLPGLDREGDTLVYNAVRIDVLRVGTFELRAIEDHLGRKGGDRLTLAVEGIIACRGAPTPAAAAEIEARLATPGRAFTYEGWGLFALPEFKNLTFAHAEPTLLSLEPMAGGFLVELRLEALARPRQMAWRGP